MTKLSGVERFTQPAAEVWRRLSDLSFLAGSIPGLTSLSRTSEDHITCKVRSGLSFLTGSLSTTIDALERTEPRIVLGIHSKGIGSMATVTATIEVGETGGGATVAWTATVDDLGGLLKPVGASLLEASAGKVISSAWAGFRVQLDAQ